MVSVRIQYLLLIVELVGLSVHLVSKGEVLWIPDSAILLHHQILLPVISCNTQ